MVMLPWLLFAIPIGALVDRLDRRFILAGSNAIRAAVIGVMALGIATEHVNIYWLIIAAFIIGVCEVAADTTSQSLIPQILKEENYEKGNSRLSISETVVQGFVGAPLGGVLYLQDVRTESAEKEKKNFIQDMKFGVHYLYNHKLLRRIVVTTSLIGVCYSMGTATMVLFLVNELDMPKPLFGVILTITGLGAIAGSIVAPKASTKFGRSKMMTFGIVSSSLVLLAQGFAPNIFVWVALATFGAFAISQWNILLMATYQTVIPNELYGRIHGTRRTIVWGMMPFGSLLGGVLAHFNLRLPMYVGGVVATSIAVFSIKFLLHFGSQVEAAQ
jgi:MFS family permease